MKTRPANPALGFWFFSRAWRMLFQSTPMREGFRARTTISRSLLSLAAIRSWV